MTEERSKKNPNKGLRRSSKAGIFAGAAALIACELPLLLAFIGLGGLSSAAVVLRPPPWMEALAVLAITVGVVVLISLAIRRRRVTREHRRI